MYLATGTEFRQLFKVNSFIEHYHEHKAEDPTLSMLEFLDIHYGHGNVLDDDYEKDMKLPFKTTNSDFSFTQWVSNFSILFHAYECNEFTESNSFIAKSLVLFSTYLSRVWQPPRLV